MWRARFEVGVPPRLPLYSAPMGRDPTSLRRCAQEPIDELLRVVRGGLCHRCGACVGICPVGALGLDGEGWPVRRGACNGCGLCVTICSGLGVDFGALGRAVFGPEYTYGDPLGVHRAAYVAHACDPEIRWAGTSGGVVTQLLTYLLETGRIRGALVAVDDPHDPSRGCGKLARTRSELLAGARSRYTTTPILSALGEAARDDGPLAAVALPCHAHALRRLQQVNPAWRSRLALVVGLYCHFNPGCKGVREVASLVAPGKKLVRVAFRSKAQGGWPRASMMMFFSDGSEWASPHGPADSVTVMGRLFPLGRCLWCVDALAELADLAVGDPWIRDERGDWKYRSPEGWSSVLVRTKTAEELFQAAREDGVLRADSIEPGEILDGQSAMILEKKLEVPARLAWRRAFGLAVPFYSPLPPRPPLRYFFRAGWTLAGRTLPAVPLLRRAAARVLFSPVGAALVRFRAAQKRRRAARRIRRRQRAKLAAQSAEGPQTAAPGALR